MMEDHKQSRNGIWDHIVVYIDYGFQKNRVAYFEVHTVRTIVFGCLIILGSHNLWKTLCTLLWGQQSCS